MFCYVVNVINVIDFVKGLNCFLFINRKVKLFVFYLQIRDIIFKFMNKI